MSKSRPDIFQFRDYREFLKDLFAFKKSLAKFSLRGLAKKAQLATGYLPMVLAGKRPLSEPALEKMLPSLGLNPSEKSYLEALVKFQNADSNDSRVAALDRMRRFQNFEKNNGNESEISEYFTHWYNVAIREMADLSEFRADAEWLQQRLHYTVTLKEAKEALDFLLSKKFIEIEKDGSVHMPDRGLECHGDVFQVALARYHRQMLALAAQSVDSTPSAERNIQGHTCALDSKNFAAAKKIVERAISEIRDLGQKTKGADTVYQMEVALFPLTEVKKGPK